MATMPHEIQPDDPRCADLLARDRIGNLTMAGELEHAEPEEVSVYLDRAEDPAGLLVEGSQWVKLYAEDEAALDRLLPAVAGRSQVRFGGVAARTAAQLAETYEVLSEHPAFLYYLDARHLPDHEPGVQIEPLRPEHAALVNEHWSYGDAEAYVRWRINAGPSAAVYDGDRPVSWALTQYDGQMAMMYTVPEARRRGLGMDVTLAMAKTMLDLGRVPFLYIEHDNSAAQKHVDRMGFSRHGDYRWFEARRKGAR